MQHIIQKPYAEDDQQSGYDADGDGAGTVCDVAGGGDADQACQRSVEAHGHVRFSVFDPGEDHTYHRCNRRSHRSGQEDGSQLLHAGGRRTVEAVPPKPQDEHAQGSQILFTDIP